jgi:hypothetical protein
MGKVAEAERQLENALLTIPTLDATFNMGHYAAKVGGLLRVGVARRMLGSGTASSAS